MMKIGLKILADALALTVLTPFAALAHTDATARLKFTTYDGLKPLDWVQRADSLRDTSAANYVFVAEQYADYGRGEASNSTSGIKGKPVGVVKNLSFEWQGNGGSTVKFAPRIHVLFTNGNYAELTWATCSKYIGVDITTGQTWWRSDFTGYRVRHEDGCSLSVYSSAGVSEYAATDTNSAWEVLAAARPSLVVKNAYWVMEGASPGPLYTWRIDRLAIQNHMWTGPGSTGVKHCTTEAAC